MLVAKLHAGWLSTPPYTGLQLERGSTAAHQRTPNGSVIQTLVERSAVVGRNTTDLARDALTASQPGGKWEDETEFRTGRGNHDAWRAGRTEPRTEP